MSNLEVPILTAESHAEKMVGHTPGPWRSYPCSLEAYSQVITNSDCMVQVAVTTPGRLANGDIAFTKEVWGDRMTYGPGDETRANARLIAAAPDLLEACEMAIGLIKLQRDLIEGGKHAAAWNPAIQMLEAARSKATGA